MIPLLLIIYSDFIPFPLTIHVANQDNAPVWLRQKNVTLFNRRCIEPVLTCELQRHRGGSTLRENHDDQVDSHVIDMMHYTEGSNDYDIEA